MSIAQASESAKTEIREMIKAAKYPQARIFATQLLKKHGNDAELLYLRGTACAHRSATEQAEKDLRAAIALAPRRIDYYLTLSNMLFSKGQYELAVKEYIRAKSISPKHPKIFAYTEILNGERGKLRRTLNYLENRYQQGKFDRALVDNLVSIYLILAVISWHSRYQAGSVLYFATSAKQIEEAEYYLAKAQSLRIVSESTQQKRSNLETLISVSKRRRFDGFVGDWVLAGVMVLIGIGMNGFLDNWYALSAIGSTWAFLRPNYLSNQSLPSDGGMFQSRFNRVVDIIYAEKLKPSHKLFEGIANKKHRDFTAKLLRSVIRVSIMPVSVFAGFYKSYSLKLALAFSAFTFSISLFFSI